MKKYSILVLIILINTIVIYFVILGLNSFETVKSKILVKSLIFSLITSIGIFYSLNKKKN